MDRPADFIDLGNHPKPERQTFRAALLEVLRRLYDQPYTSSQVTRVMRADPKFANREGVNGNVRYELCRMASSGEIDVVVRGSRGIPTTYCNTQGVERMLVLTRSPKEGKNTLLIGDDIRIIIKDVVGHKQVKVGIEAPGLQILREEVEDDGRQR